ncbi:MAG: glycosyl hydrolase, partial [Tepidisphaeraceae bacterium]
SVGLKKADVVAVYEAAAKATCDHYIDDITAADGIPYWDDGAPNLHKLGDWKSKPANPLNDFEPVDSSAAAIGAQGLLRLGHYLGAAGDRYTKAGIAVVKSLFAEPYLSTDADHQGLILHSIYHRPNNWDYIPAGRKIPSGESSMWGDYHAVELAVYLKRLIEKKPYLTFFDAK